MTLLVLRALPNLDVGISALFFEHMECWKGPNAPGFNKYSPRCGKFLLAQNATLEFLRMVIWWSISLLALATLISACWWIWAKKPNSIEKLKASLVGLVSYLIGPAIIVNIILKEHWGRPRPSTTFDFGSKLPYVPPGDISMHCDTNCSFVSGEATASFWALWIVLFLPPKFRLAGFIIIGSVAVLTSLGRVMFGAHYFSDVVMSAMIAFTSIAIAHWFVHSRYFMQRLEKLFQ